LVHDCHTSHEPPRSDRRSPLSRLSPASRGGASCSKKTVSLEEVEDRGTHAPGPVSGNRGRHLRTPPTQTGGSAAGAGLRRTPQPGRHDRCEAPRQPLWVTHTHQAGRRRCRGAARGTKMAGRGASRQSRHRRLPRFSSDAVPHRLAKCSRARRGGVGDAGGIEPACTDAPDGARPRGERKDALDTVALRRSRAQVVASIAAAAAASVGVKPQAEAPHSAPVAPRNALRRRLRKTTVSSTSSLCRRRRRLLRGCQAAGRGIRRRLRRATRFVGAFAAAPAEHARALSAIDPCCRHELAQLGSMSAASP
jgi:hypothetical protein